MATPKSEIQALVVESKGNVTIKQVPFPTPGRGDVTVRILASYVNPNSQEVLVKGGHFLPGPEFPYVWGCQAVGRVEATGGDEVYVKKGDLVALDNLIRARDIEEVTAVQGLFHKFSPQSKKLLDMYKDGFYAEYTRVPLENVHVMNEELLFSKHGYKMEDLPQLSRYAVAMGALNRINLKAGETVVIAPSTGKFSGDTVQLASAMGATVIAASRNKTILDQLEATVPRVHALQLTGDVEKDAAGMQQWGSPDAFVDYTPNMPQVPSYFTSALQALKPRGRVCLEGAPMGNLEIPYAITMFKNLEFYFNFMFTRADQQQVVRMAESGALPLGKNGAQTVQTFTLQEWKKAFEVAEKDSSWGKSTAFVFKQ